MLVRPPGLVLEHGYVLLQTLVHFALSLDFRFDCAKMLQLDELRLKALLLVLPCDLAGSGRWLLILTAVGSSLGRRRLLHILLLHSVLTRKGMSLFSLSFL